MIITDKAQIKVAELKEFNNLRLSGSNELECYELIESDLKLPVDATFTRSSVAYLSDGAQVDANTPRFEQGWFGKAIMVEEGTTNLLPTSKTNYPAWEKGAGIASVSFAEETFYGFPVCLITAKNDGLTASTYVRTLNSSIPLTLNIGDKYSATFYVKKVNHRYVGFRVFISGPYGASQSVLDLDTGQVYANNPEQQISAVYMGNDWWKVIVINPSLTLTTGYVGICLPINSAGDENTQCIGQSVLLARTMQLEAKPYSTSFIDGTRSPESLTIPTAGVLNPQEGTIEFRIYPLELHDWNDYLGGTGGYPGGRWLLFVGASGQLAWSWSPGPEISTSSGVIVARTWYYVVLRWGQGVKSIWVNGVKKAQGSHDGSYGFPNPFGFGVVLTYDVNTLIDDLRISNCARTDAEILAAYQSGKPLPADEWTTYKLDFDDKVRITTQGQIICNELIEI